MEDSRELARSLYDIHPMLLFVGVASVFGMVQFLTAVPPLLTLFATRVTLLILALIFCTIAYYANKFTIKLLSRFDYCLPTVVMWFYPMVAIFCGLLLSILLLMTLPSIAGRDFWSILLRLNAKTTTVIFTSAFMSFYMFIGLLVMRSAINYLKWYITLGETLGKETEPLIVQPRAEINGETGSPDRLKVLENGFQALKVRIVEMEALRNKAKKFNRIGMLAMFGALIVSMLWITFMRPELILYYRGEIQIRTFQRPDMALDAFRQIIDKYPDYKYLDTVIFRHAWILERRMEKWQDALKAYEAFLDKYGADNVWSDDVVASLVRINADKLKDYRAALKWARFYLKHYPDGLLVPQVMIYEIRALHETGDKNGAAASLKRAGELFGGRNILLFDNEDDFTGLINFDWALQALDLSKSD